MIPAVTLAFLVFTRVAALLMTLPLVGGGAVPALARMALALPLTVVMLPAAGSPSLDLSLSGVVGALIMEILLGAAMGFCAQLAFHVLAMAFEIIGAQAGLTIGAIIDPIAGQQNAVLATFATWIATAVFLGADVHLGCIRAVAQSFATAPPGHVAGLAAAGQGLVSLAEVCFEGAVQLAGPLTVFVFAVNLGQSLLGRMAPNIQLFWAIGPVLSVGIGLFVLAAVMPSLISTWFALMPQALAVMNALPAGR